MIAYSKTGLDNLHIQDQAKEALANQCISEVEEATIKQHYAVDFYTPNFFIRVGLFILTAIAICFAMGLFLLMAFSSSSIDEPTGLFFLGALLSYGALELFVRGNKHYCSGVDDALLWSTFICLVTALNFINYIPMVVYALVLFLLSGYLSLRFVDSLMTAIACLSALGVVFFGYLELGAVARLTMPFVMMATAAGIYLIGHRLSKAPIVRYYSKCLLVVRVVTLLCFYAAGNYFVVREIGSSFFEVSLAPNQSIPFAWLFWAFTVSIPMLYMLRGVLKKDAVWLRTGLLLLAVMVITIRQYYHVMPIEVVLLIGGAIMMGVAYSLIRYLAQPRNGFTYKEGYEPSPINKLQVEALIINQTFSAPQAPDTGGTRLGGGSGGGAGAGEDY
jgi:hypothetical protein